ncbi:peptidase M20D, amidohydrolase [Toxoplasma gondii TgCatPRC2]|uniref:Amidohydrolase domain-containing protein n=13 Tax=Toxoplasma gondii TaxID=5811 RepID=A0A125YWW1_TOXGV|nr:peptidase M20D, amidohydrolase [Toxoplasma gondii ME49]EPR59540.1 peptidase M20D, amidohydrolase [Toxoplasma gondii GT1]ESS30775.1 peptidase M20D, amidohydrolase [Toxoplasma gondii VEG]KAF4643717.1 peptidase M20D, amidohydrolase [Toxoplasma gondii]KFG40307.1 peptidase M20D, amidohydrolase [Toxoplasma gondii GAB2-2007-GAL-DOM2]KFG44386.1 peptidase M20D, amidohydrolase [Toxoplasma gondii p89]KFG54924.1 peptidase M20D, amidohydrolase [Toxoplasma gondii FOU]KFH08630.1 peptidase M20D, amidohyd|eukprot:XP_002371089.1 peptidase M20D, amidohydrolase [Toxoplasma gondii ME49]
MPRGGHKKMASKTFWNRGIIFLRSYSFFFLPLLAAAASSPASDDKYIIPDGELQNLLAVPTNLSSLSNSGSLVDFSTLFEAASETSFNAWIVAVRRALHQWPETAYNEYRTSALIHKLLKAMNVRVTTGWGTNTIGMSEEEAKIARARREGTGLVAEIGTGKEPCVALRADIDALPIFERTNVPFRSKVDGQMHACGHDVHTTMLLGAAALLKQLEPHMEGTIRLIFQPAEEGGGGALMMREEGVLTMAPPVEFIFGMHVAPALPTGELATRKGAMMAAATQFSINVKGRGGHGAVPHETIDPSPGVAAIVQGLYAIVARETSFTENTTGLISVTRIQGGTAFNVIPSEYFIGGTIRALDMAMMRNLQARVVELVENLAQAFRCQADVKYGSVSYVPLVNDPDATEFFIQTAAPASRSGRVGIADPTLGGEDFAFFLEDVPGTFAVIGIGSGAEHQLGHVPTNIPLHNPNFAVDERVLNRGAAVHAFTALRAFSFLASKKRNAGAAETRTTCEA